ncbi:MAG TPA: hypothetical protein VIU40_06040 [Geobacteraceae bacterium]
MSEIKTLKTQLETKESELLQLKLELIERRINELQQHGADIEFRLRLVETSRTRLETLAWLAFGGGAVSLVNILKSIVK